MISDFMGIFEDFVEKIRKESLELKDFLLHTEPEKKLLLFYSMGFLSDSYSMMAEEALKKNKEYEATYFSGKAAEVRQACNDIFGDFPEKEYYKELEYKIPKWANFKTPIEQIQQIAAFCATNLQISPETASDSKTLIKEVVELMKGHKRTGIERKYITVMKKKYEELKNKPAKMGTLYEMLLLLINVKQVIFLMSGKQKEEEESLPGFKV